MNRKQRLYRERVLNNLCTNCGNGPPQPGSKMCQQCKERKKGYVDKDKAAANKKRLKAERIRKGVCIFCASNIPAPGKLGCTECNKYSQNASKKHKNKKVNNKICLRCKNDVRYQKYKICQDCRRKELTAKNKVYLDKGLCRTCGKNPIRGENKTLCQDCVTRLKKNNTKRKLDRWNRILDHYGRKCNCCGEAEINFLTVDHINNDGATHKRIMKSKDPGSVRKWIVDNGFPDTIQILCYNCNCAKGKLGYCPHQLKHLKLDNTKTLQSSPTNPYKDVPCHQLQLVPNSFKR